MQNHSSEQQKMMATGSGWD